MNKVISYTTSSYYQNMEDMLHECCERFDLQHERYDQEWFHSTEYYSKHKDVADQRRMAGFAIWKPFIILDALRKVEENDVICYLDASVVFEEDPRPFFDTVKFIAVGNADDWVNRDWIKRDAFILMNADSSEFWNARQIWAGQIVVRKNNASMTLMEEFLTWCEDRRIITDEDNVCGLPNFSGFRENRSEQAILAIMAVIYPEFISHDPTVFHDYAGNWSEWIPWSKKGRR